MKDRKKSSGPKLKKELRVGPKKSEPDNPILKAPGGGVKAGGRGSRMKRLEGRRI